MGGSASVKSAGRCKENPILAEWDFPARKDRSITVLPDGCRDLIVSRDPATGMQALLFSDLDVSRKTMLHRAGQQLVGFRLRPGATLPARLVDEVRRALERPSGDAQPDLVGQAIATYAELNDDLVEAIAAGRTVVRAARLLGVAERTLHRRMLARTGRPPSFWLDLARSRRALVCLSTGMTLVEVAAEAGYADQAHLTRSFGARFGVPPGAFRNDPALMRLAVQPGFAG